MEPSVDRGGGLPLLVEAVAQIRRGELVLARGDNGV
jgi:hypothetical protein